MGADLVSLANNHAYDYGKVSLMDSLDTLQGLSIPYMGAGRNLEEAARLKPVQGGADRQEALTAEEKGAEKTSA